MCAPLGWPIFLAIGVLLDSLPTSSDGIIISFIGNVTSSVDHYIHFTSGGSANPRLLLSPALAA
jgi:hypothetical protein